MKIHRRNPRKLLTASLGVAAVSYVACGNSGNGNVVANLIAPPSEAGFDSGDASPEPSGAAPGPADSAPEVAEAASDASGGGPSFFDVVANLVALPPDANGH